MAMLLDMAAAGKELKARREWDRLGTSLGRQVREAEVWWDAATGVWVEEAGGAIGNQGKVERWRAAQTGS